ncbi:hypothetical protein CPC08DRAFT_708272 [Agrocybe pediades]|nr:hypothetical protein CPC08DRAFT_708272 [Agrocybe pediades]
MSDQVVIASNSPDGGANTPEVVEKDVTGSMMPNATQQTEICHAEAAQLRVLRTYELLDLIISFMVDLSLGPRLPLAPPDSVDIIRASLTSRAFFNPAMNALWRCMDSWPAILHLISNLVQDSGIYTTKDVILEEHLERLSSYTRRIRHFSFSKLSEKMSPHIYTALLRFREKQLFPGLLTLSIPTFGEVCNSKMPPFSLLLSPTLTEISIHGVRPAHKEILAASLLDMAASFCPKINIINWSGDFSDTTLNAIPGFPALEKLEISSENAEMSGMIFHKLSQIKGLKSLDIYLGKAITVDKFVHSPGAVTFPALETLQIRGPSNAIFYVLNNMSFSTISSLGLNFSSTPEEDQSPEHCLNVIEAKGATKTLRSIRIVADDPSSVMTRIDIMRHLNEYGPQVENVDVESITYLHYDLQFSLCDHVFTPNLKSLKYVAQSPSSLIKPTRLPDLDVIANYMDNLKKLHIPVALDIDEDEVELLQLMIGGERKCHPLEEITLRPLTMQDPEYDAVANDPGMLTALDALTVGNYLNFLFPHLKSVDLSRFSKIDETWRKTVEDVVLALQKERRRLDERGLCCKTCTNFPKDF